MGFYGNITNTSKTQFLFDKIYANRYNMDYSRTTDGIYAGRYVLVEYDTNFSHDDYHQVRVINNLIYRVNSADQNVLVKKGDFEDGDIVYTADEQYNPSAGYFPKNVIYYRINFDKNGTPGLTLLVSTVNDDGNSVPNYTINYNIDIGKYGTSRGYDSTVWQKTYIDGYEKYIMIAELNSVVPTFDVSADAPTVAPLVPHFDTHSTDIYYKLHWQPSWGFRIAEAGVENKKDLITKSSDTNIGKYPSDAEVSYDTTTYNPNTGKNNNPTTIKYKGAIYFNKDGLDVTKHNYYDSTTTGNFIDLIAIRPSGISGNKYNKHDGTVNTATAPDIQEMRVILPSLGNTICHLWDMAYGYNGDNDNKRYRDVEWKDAETGEENRDIGGMTRNLETIAGCINSVHDLMGMIITESIPSNLTETEYNKKLIYKKSDGYYRIQRNPSYTLKTYTPLSRLNNETDLEYNKRYKEDINAKFGSDAIEKIWYAVKVQNNIQISARRINIYTASNLKSGEKLGYHSGYTYKLVKIEGFAGELSTVNGLILQLKDLLESDNTETRNAKTVQGTINSLNDIIKMFEDLIPGEPIIVDASGKVTSANWTTEQSLTYTNVGGAEKPSDNTAENQWILMSIDKNNKLITLNHNAHTADDTSTSSNKNGGLNETGLNKNDTSKLTSKDLLKLYTPIIDNCGHVVGKNTETVTLPYGYKTLSTPLAVTSTNDLYTTIEPKGNGNYTTTVSSEETSCSAESTQDNIEIVPVNKWILTKVENGKGTDTIKIAHSIHGITTAEKSETNLNDKINGDILDTITIQDLEFDEAGHVTANLNHGYRLPYGYKTISTSKNNDNKTSDLYTSITPGLNNSPDMSTVNVPKEMDDCVAGNTQDKLTISPINKWILIKTINDDATSGDVVQLAHEVHAIDSTLTETDLNDALPVGFVVKDLSFDKAGHATKNITHKYTLPYGYKTVKFKNYNDDYSHYTSIAAENKIDTIGLLAEDRWITLNKASTGKNITIIHADAGEVNKDNIKKTTNGIGDNNNNAILKFDSSFKIPLISYDTKGHIISNTSLQITLLKPSISGTQDANHESQIITSISLPQQNIAEGKFVYGYDNISNLKLTGYADVDKDDTTNIYSGDSINQAFKKVEAKITSNKSAISTEITNREKAIEGLQASEVSFSADQTISKWSETNGIVSITPLSISITESNIAGTIPQSKITNLTTVLGNKETKGTANAVKTELIGSTTDTTGDKLTLNYLLNRINTLEQRIVALGG